MDYFLIAYVFPVLVGLWVLYKTMKITRTPPPVIINRPTITPQEQVREEFQARHIGIVNDREVLIHYSNRGGFRVPDAEIILNTPLLTEAQRAMMMEGINPFAPSLPAVNEPEPAPIADNRRLELS